MSVVGKIYSRVLMNRARKGAKAAIGKEQCGFKGICGSWPTLNLAFDLGPAYDKSSGPFTK